MRPTIDSTLTQGEDTSTILGVRVHRISYAQTFARIQQFIASRRFHRVATVNLDFLRLASSDHYFRHVLNTADLALADGMPVVWLSKLQRQPLPERVAGVDIVTASAELAAKHGHKIFMLGAAPGVARLAATNLVCRHAALTEPYTYSPPVGQWSHREEREILERIAEARPDFLFVALGAPRQDVWLYEHRHELHVPVCVGVGGSLDILAGRKPRAPRLVQRAGLEWAYRLQHEPRRLWRRYLLQDSPFLLSAIRQIAISSRTGSSRALPRTGQPLDRVGSITPITAASQTPTEEAYRFLTR